MRPALLLLGAPLLAACTTDYVGMSRQLAIDAQAATGEPLVERQRSYFENDLARPRLETTVKLYPDGRRVKHGPEREWYADGTLKWERAFADGEPQGAWTSWHPNGQKASEATFGASEPTPMTWWHPSGQMSTHGLAIDGAREGPWTSWYPDGTKKSEGAYRAGLREGTWTFWNEDGSLLERGAYRLGERVGRWERGG